ncbi:hypothetical protein Tco_1146453 [Tanacetum coccineum]
MKDQPLPADASPTTLSPSYIANFKPKEDEKDPEEDPADYPANEGDNSDDDLNNHTLRSPSAEACITEFAAALPSSSPPPENVESLKDNIREMMTTVNQRMSVEEIELYVMSWL